MMRNVTVWFSLMTIIIIIKKVSLSQRKFTDHFIVSVKGGRYDALRLANKHGFHLLYEVFPNTYVFKRKDGTTNAHIRRGSISLMLRESRIMQFEQQQYNIRVLRNSTITFNDPNWKDMWYINMNTTNAIPDQGVLTSWSQGFTGRGIVIGIVDNGVEINHPDLSENLVSGLSFNFIDGTSNPSPESGHSHGTKCAGIAAAVGNNGHCILGTSYGAKFIALKMMDSIGSTSAWEAGALSYRSNDIDIYSNSWGVIDRKGFHDPSPAVIRAIENGVNHASVNILFGGRRGKGSIYIWAAGNGGPDDNCNCDGYVNNIHTIAISGVTYDLYSAHYSERCSVIMACTYGSDDLEYLVKTTDLHGQCGNFTGTSATAPMAAGILALTLEANNNLTWRDIQHLIVKTSKPHNLRGGTWKTNAAGHQYHDFFGYGLLDAKALVDEAKQWKGLPKFRKCSSIIRTANINVDHLNLAEDIITSDGCNQTNDNYVEFLEHVQVSVQFSANLHKDVLITIASPANTLSQLLTARPYDDGSGQQSWVFSSVHFWGESPTGNWTIRMSIPVNTNQGRLLTWQLHLYGTSIDPSLGPENETDSVDIKPRAQYDDSALSGWKLAVLIIGILFVIVVIVVIVVTVLFFIYRNQAKKRGSKVDVSTNQNT